MIEDRGIASHYRYHQLRLLYQFIAMREFRDELIHKGIEVHYFELPQSEKVNFFQRIETVLKEHRTKKLQLAQIPDVHFKKQFIKWAKHQGIEIEFLDSPQFIVSESEFNFYLEKHKKPFMKTFYEGIRKSKKILLNADSTPVGGKWSFDVSNRKRLNKNIQIPALPEFPESQYQSEVTELIVKYFSNHPGMLPENKKIWVPTNRKNALSFLNNFLNHRFKSFGPYEDAIDPDHNFLFHSGLSPLINLGLLSPEEVIEKAILFSKKNEIPIESLEGFIRQIIGWREFIYGIHCNYDQVQKSLNFFNHKNKLKPCWYNGTTGLPPVDDAIKKAQRLAYNHHIERLMILSNVMLLSEIHPQEVHRWFMEMYLDSYEWVMGPNVYGMAQFSDGGIFATKPYISGSNYILKMSSYEKGDWCEIWDGLYWSFIHRHQDFFSKNPRLSMMIKMLKKMNPQRRSKLFELSDNFKANKCMKNS